MTMVTMYRTTSLLFVSFARLQVGKRAVDQRVDPAKDVKEKYRRPMNVNAVAGGREHVRRCAYTDAEHGATELR